jgi:hypothetical protein
LISIEKKTANVGRMSSKPQTSFTDTELMAPFPHGILPDSEGSRDASGALDDATLAAYVASLKKSGVVPPLVTNLDVYHQNISAFITNCKKEYHYYDDRYKYSLSHLFNAVRNGYDVNTPDTQNTIKKYLDTTTKLNKKLNDLIQITTAVTTDMMQSSDAMETEIKEYNKRMEDQKAKLAEQSRIISSSQATTKIKKEMVKYTEEKARYTDNLLKVYSFLNIVALGLLVYIYKAAN